MTRVTLHFGGKPEVACDRMRLHPAEVEVGDYIVCPFSGFVHVHAVEQYGGAVHLVDCDGRAHVYYRSAVLELARPVR